MLKQQQIKNNSDKSALFQALRERLEAVAAMTGTQCCFKVGEAMLPEELLPRLCTYHEREFCMAVKYGCNVERRCVVNDGREIPEHLSRNLSPWVKVCHANAVEVIIPFVGGSGECTGVVMIGPFRSAGKRCAYPGAAEPYDKLPVLTSELEHSLLILIPTIFGDLIHEIYINNRGKLPKIPHDERILNALDEIHQRFRTQISVKELAAKAFLSESRFIHLFCSECGISYSDYLMELRLDEARRFALSPVHSIREVASLCGFTHQSYFAAMFKRRYGLSPLQHRQDYLKKLLPKG